MPAATLAISAEERRVRLFNIILEQLMPELDRLQTLQYDFAWNYAQDISSALERLYAAIEIKNNTDSRRYGPRIDEDAVRSRSRYKLLTFDEMLDARIPTWVLKGFQPDFGEWIDESYYYPATSLRNVIKNLHNGFGVTTTASNMQRKFAALNIEQLVNVNPDVVSTLNQSLYSTKINSRKLCQLAQDGDLATIKKYNFGSAELNILVKDAVRGDPPSCLGDYNALHIAAAYRHLDVVKFFVEEKNADVHIKGGRKKDFTALDCSKQKWWSWFFNQQMNPELSRFLTEKMRQHQQSRITNGLQHTFLSPPQVLEARQPEMMANERTRSNGRN